MTIKFILHDDIYNDLFHDFIYHPLDAFIRHT